MTTTHHVSFSRAKVLQDEFELGEGKLLVGPEIYWKGQYDYLKYCGYLLRERYKPNWVPSWKDTSKTYLDCEDGVPLNFHHPELIDAQRLRDNTAIMLKRVTLSPESQELYLAHYLCSRDAVYADSRNHCVPVFEILNIPGDHYEFILVMPLLSQWYHPGFDTIGEVLEFFRQIFEGVQYMHNRGVAHNDLKWNNMLMDAAPLYESEPHPFMPAMRLDFKGKSKAAYRRTRRPVVYYIIDFGLSVPYTDEKPRLQLPGYGGDHSVPEFRSWDTPIDPFPVDVYRLGNIIRQEFTEGYSKHGVKKKKGFEFIEPLIADMTMEDPELRPTMNQVMVRFSRIVKKLSKRKLRSRIADVDEHALVTVFRSMCHWIRQLGYCIEGIPPMPSPECERDIQY